MCSKSVTGFRCTCSYNMSLLVRERKQEGQPSPISMWILYMIRTVDVILASTPTAFETSLLQIFEIAAKSDRRMSKGDWLSVTFRKISLFK